MNLSAGDPEARTRIIAFMQGLQELGWSVGTRTIPIVFVNVVDPVASGFVQSLSRPRGNATGFTLFEYGITGKLPELLSKRHLNIARVAILQNPAEPLLPCRSQFMQTRPCASAV